MTAQSKVWVECFFCQRGSYGGSQHFDHCKVHEMPQPEVEIAKTNIGDYEEKEVLEFFQLNEETDPNGIDQHAPGAKLDAGKIDVGLLFESFPRALLAVAEVATFGANKYTRGGWKEVEGGLVRYAAAEGRHKLYRYMGEHKDPESKLTHRQHEVWNALAQLEFSLKDQDVL